MQGRIFDIKQFAIHDGEGIRTTVFLKGCPLDCWWCHNPESKNAPPQLVYHSTTCAGTGECVDACPEDALVFDGGEIEIDREACTHCFACVDACPSAALQSVGRTVSVTAVLEEVQKSEIFFDSSGGGLTVSGGEPLQQPEFAETLLRDATEIGIATTLDTSGYASDGVMDAVAPYVDDFLYDLKFVDEDIHRKYTGVSNGPVLENLERLADRGRGEDVIIRRPVITDVNDAPEQIEAFVNFIDGFPAIDRVDLLPFHDVSEKYDRFGMEYRVENRDAPADATLQRIRETLDGAGYAVKVSGF